VHLGTDVPLEPATPPQTPALVTVGNLIARKRHADVIEAMAMLRDRWPQLRYTIVGDGPERAALHALASARGLADRVTLRGRLSHADAVAEARRASLFVLPSVAEAFGVAYVEAMAAGVPAIGVASEDGPAEIAGAGGGIELVPPRDPRALAGTIDALLSDAGRLTSLRDAARDTVVREFTWERCAEGVEAVFEELMR